MKAKSLTSAKKVKQLAEGIPLDGDLEAMRELISLCDSYLINRFLETSGEMVEKGQLGSRMRKEWDRLRDDLYAMAAFPSLSPSVRRLVSAQVVLRFAFTILVASAAILVIVSFTGYASFLQDIAPGFFLSFVLLATLYYFLRLYLQRSIALSVDKWFSQNPEEFAEFRELLARLTQALILRFAQMIEAQGERANEWPLDLFFEGYTGLRVLKTPGLLRKYYTAIPQLNQEVER
jgi:hypothetical protein